MSTITLQVFAHILDDDPSERHTFASRADARRWLDAQPDGVAFSVAVSE